MLLLRLLLGPEMHPPVMANLLCCRCLLLPLLFPPCQLHHPQRLAAAAGVVAPQQEVEGPPRLPRLLLPLALQYCLTAAPAVLPPLPVSLLEGLVEGMLVLYLLLLLPLAVVVVAACLTAAALQSWLPWSYLLLLLESPTCSCACCQHLHYPLLRWTAQQGQTPPQHPTQAAVGPQGQGWLCVLRLPAVMLPVAWGPSLGCWQQGQEAPAAAQQAASGRRQLPCHLVVAGCCQAFLRRLLLPATASHCGQTGGVVDLPMELVLLLMHHPSPLLLLLLLGNRGGWGAQQAAAAAAVPMRLAQAAEANPMGGRHAVAAALAAAVPAGGRQEVGLALPTATSQAAAVVAAAVAFAAAAAVTAAVPVPARVHLDAKRAAWRQQLLGNSSKSLGLLCWSLLRFPHWDSNPGHAGESRG